MASVLVLALTGILSITADCVLAARDDPFGKEKPLCVNFITFRFSLFRVCKVIRVPSR